MRLQAVTIKLSSLILAAFLCTSTALGGNEKLVEHARAQIGVTIRYDPEYQVIPYPNGDIEQYKGVCTDVVIRAMRKHGLDLQKAVHEDMKAHFSKYPSIWGLRKTDKNIDHRRVPNLQTYFKRKGWELKVSENPQDYLPGDIVTFILGGSLPHIGIVSDKKTESGTPLVIHNIGAGTQEEDCLFVLKLTGHYRPVLK